MAERKLILTRGIPGSGKTTWAKQQPHPRANRDDLRWQLFGHRPTDGLLNGEQESAVTRAQRDLVKAFLRHHDTVIVDDTNLNNRFMGQWYRFAELNGLTVEFKDFEVPLETALDWDRNREYPVGEAVIRKFYGRTKDGKLPAPPTRKHVRADLGAVTFEQYVPGESLPWAWGFDLDGTLAHIQGENPRSPYDGARAGEDAVDPIVRDIALSFQRNYYKILIVSGRNEDYRHVTEEWLERMGIHYHDLFMRASGDDRSDNIVKYEILRDQIAPKYALRGMVDDRDQVVAMWRQVGVKCLQAEYGDF